MNIALRFIRPELDSIKIFSQACEEIRQKHPGLAFTFIVPDNIIALLLSEIPNFGFTSTKELQRNDVKFKEVIDCTAILVGIDRSKRQTLAIRHIASHVSITSSNKATFQEGIILEGVCDPCDGYGANAHDLVKAFARSKVNCNFVPTRQGNMHMVHRDVRHALDSRNLLYKSYLLYHTPMLSATYGRVCNHTYKAILTMFETTSAPSVWPGHINEAFDKLIVPSEFCKEVFVNGGVSKPVDVIPLGVDPAMWPYKDRSSRSGRFRFLMFANAHWENPRKNYQLTLDAFTHAFHNNKNVELILKLTGGFHGRRPYLPKNARVINERVDQQGLVRLLHEADCLLFPSSGEGYGLPPREAMCTGLPVVLCNWSSLTAICNPEISYWVNPSGLVRATLPSFLKSANQGSSYFGEYAKVDISDLTDVMLRIYRNRDKALRRGKAAAQYIKLNETCDIAVAKLCQSLHIGDRNGY